MISKALLIILLLGGSYGSHKSGHAKPNEKVQVGGFEEGSISRVDVSQDRTERIRSLEVALKDTLLADQAETFVEVAERYDFDYRLLPAIAFSESGLCHRFRRSTFNCWGWGNGQIAFQSFEEAIRTIGYKLVTLPAYEAWREDKSNLSTLAERYCGVDNEQWVNKINYFYKVKIKKP